MMFKRHSTIPSERNSESTLWLPAKARPAEILRFEDTCNVYALCSGEEAVLVDFGDGSVLDKLPAYGIHRASDVLMTHHHRDQGQGLPRAVAAGARVWVPEAEQDLFQAVDRHWQAREVFLNYNVRQDRFSLLDPVLVGGLLRDYETLQFAPVTITVLPAPGHTPGSVILFAEIDGVRIAFTGDLIAGAGKVWSMAATQWSYNGAEGAAATIASLLDLKDRHPDVLFPSHGEPIYNPGEAIDLLVSRLRTLLDYRKENPRLFSLRDQPYIPITSHLLFNRTSMANSYVLLSDSGKALVIDFGYDFMTGMAAGADRASRRPWLYTLGSLKRAFGVQKVDVVMPTHYHDDHVAGINLLRRVEGTQVWAAKNFASILENPGDYDLPCLWFDPIPVDRVLSLGRTIAWEEYRLTVYPLPGHTRHAVAIAFEVDGKRILAVGDQFEGVDGLKWNYVYRNRFQAQDYRISAELIQKVSPDVILPGHQEPLFVRPEYLAELIARGQELERLHHELASQDENGLAVEEVEVFLRPYQSRVSAGETAEYIVEVTNPFPSPKPVQLELILPEGWQADKMQDCLDLQGHETGFARFAVTPAGAPEWRVRLAVDVTIGSQRFGQAAEALVTVKG